MKALINSLKNDSEAAFKLAAAFAGLLVAALSVMVIVTRLF